MKPYGIHFRTGRRNPLWGDPPAFLFTQGEFKMTSAARAAINRDNAQASTGPRTASGKERSSMNALGHGMASKAVVLPHESAEEYKQLHRGLIDSYKPANEREIQLVELIAQSFWRLQRCYGVERAFLENRIAASEEADPDAAMANLFIDKAEAGRMRLLMRYLAAAERAHSKAVADLQKAQAERRKQEREEAAAQEFVALYTRSEMPATGFVSQPDPHKPNVAPVSAPSLTMTAGAA
jgi:hypothetical protein